MKKSHALIFDKILKLGTKLVLMNENYKLDIENIYNKVIVANNHAACSLKASESETHTLYYYNWTLIKKHLIAHCCYTNQSLAIKKKNTRACV